MKLKRLKKLISTLFLSMFYLISFAQSHSVTGVVRDAQGEPMIGVNVLVKGTPNGAITDLDGRYSVTGVDSKSVLVISYIGYLSQEITIGDQTTINVTLKDDSQALDEIVVVGYGVQKKSDLTGSVASVSSDRITSIGTTSVMSALQGASPGVDIISNSTRPGSSFKIKVRGQNSISEGNPLYVVDGIVTDDIDFLSPSDIERIDILKDASSTAIYGSRGSNGVIMVQTKGAQSSGSKLTVSYDGYYGVRKIARVPDFMDGRENIDYRTSRYYEWDTTLQSYKLTPSNQAVILQNSTQINSALYNEDYTDWLDLGTQNGTQQSHAVNISGSGKDISYNIGAAYQSEKGNFVQENMDRYTMKGSLMHKANQYFTSGANFTLAHMVVSSGSQNGYRDLMRMMPFFKAYDDEGNIIDQPGIAANINGTGNFTSSGNPLNEIYSGTAQNRRFDVQGNVFLEFKPIEGLSLKTTFSPRLNQKREGYYYGVTSDRSKDEAQTENRTRFDWTWDNIVNWNKTFAQKHGINATLIHSVYKTETELLRVRANNFPYNSEWYNIFNGTLVPAGNTSSYSQTTLLSYAARVNYDYLGKYLFTGTVRYDGSSKLADKWAAFPSAALAWRISEEAFLKDVAWIYNLKARLSLGYSGNNNINAYSTIVSPSTDTNVYYDFGGSVVNGFGVGTPVNSSLTWEKTREWNFGVDFGFLDGRISGTIDLYDKLSDGLLMDRTLTFESGASKMTDNIGSVNNRGIEIGLTTVNFRNKDWEWRTTFNFARNKNAIRSLYGKKEDVVGEARFIGEAINVIYDWKVSGVYSQAEWAAMSAEQRVILNALYPGAPRVLDTDGVEGLSVDDKVVLGSSDPDWTGSLTSTLQFRNFDFSFNIYTRQGVFINDTFYQEFNGASSSDRGRPKVKFDYYVPGELPRYDWSNFTVVDGYPVAQWGTSTENATAKYPVHGLRGEYYGNNGSYQNASFVKVRNITLGYTFNKRLLSKTGLAHARVYVNVLNPFVFTDYVGWDPEYGSTGLTSGNGPSSVTYQVGVNLKF